MREDDKVKVFAGIEAVDPPLERSVLAIGNFDGVHLGHQQLLAQSGLFAANTGGPVVVLTFEPHPLSVVSPDKTPRRLSSPEEKLQLLADAGADLTVVAHSDRALLSLEPERFIKEVIIDIFHPAQIVEGPSFGFGKGRRGTPELLRSVAAGFGCEVHILEPVCLQVTEGETLLVSSSLVRKLLEEGKVRRAALCLGRRYSLGGKVVRGYGRGRTLGFPTTNIEVVDRLIPGDGVYAARAFIGRSSRDSLPCAVSIGHAPTFNDSPSAPRQIEAHLIGLDRDVYGEHLRIEFGRRLRGQRKFDSADDLTRQLEVDVRAVRLEVQQSLSDTSEWESLT